MRSYKKRSSKKSRAEITAREAAISAAIDFAQKAQASAPILFRPNTPAEPRRKTKPHGRKPTNQSQPINSNPAMQDALSALFLATQARNPQAAPEIDGNRSLLVGGKKFVKKSPASTQSTELRREPGTEKKQRNLQQKITKIEEKPKPSKNRTKNEVRASVAAFKKALKTRQSKARRKIAYKQSNASARKELNKKLSGRSETPDISPFHLLHQRWLRAVSYLAKFQPSDPTGSDVLAKQLELESIEKEWLRRMGLKAGDPDYFPWPSTHIDHFSATSSAGGRRETGMLSYLGYRVGMSSPYTSDQRVRLLNYIFEGILPPVDSLAYYREWGPPKSSSRLRKMADTIASFVKDAKRRRATNMTVAIQHWEADLSYLRKAFYQGRFNFAWPDTRP